MLLSLTSVHLVRFGGRRRIKGSRGTFSPKGTSLLDVEYFLTMLLTAALTRNMWRKSDILTEVSIKFQSLWNATFCRQVSNRRFGATDLPRCRYLLVNAAYDFIVWHLCISQRRWQRFTCRGMLSCVEWYRVTDMLEQHVFSKSTPISWLPVNTTQHSS
jgi:hypothetical protein